jgi:protein-disulfide isomerase
MCIFSYAVNLLLLYFSWLIHNRFGCESILKSVRLDVRYLLTYPKSLGLVLSFFGIGAVLMILFFPSYWQSVPLKISHEIPSGMTEDGYPWIGAEKPELVIEEFSDYMCPQCKKMHFFLRRMIQAYPEKIRLIHRHFPMDHTFNPIIKEPFHIGSARLALVAIYFAEQGKFWEINDVLYNLPRQTESVNFLDLAKQAGLTLKDIKPVSQESALWKKLQQDIEAGIKYKLTGTPGFVIDGKVYTGQIPASVFNSHGILETKKNALNKGL